MGVPRFRVSETLHAASGGVLLLPSSQDPALASPPRSTYRPVEGVDSCHSDKIVH